MAWNLTDEDTLEPFENITLLNQGLNTYYNTVKGQFLKLNEIKFIDSSRFLLMNYVEKRDRDPSYEKYQGDPSKEQYFVKS